MRGRLSLFVLLASSLVFLASLFLPWREAQAPPFKVSTLPLLNAVSETGRTIDGWIAGAGDFAVLTVVALVIATIAALRRRGLAARLPIGSLGVALGYFAVSVALAVHAESTLYSSAFAGHPALHTSWSYGFYVGLASAAVAVLCAIARSGSELLRLQGAADVVAAVLGIALLVSFLLPWIGFRVPSTFSYPGITAAPAAIAALGLIVGAGWLHRGAGRRWRLPAAVATAVLTGGAASAVLPFGSLHRYGTWIGVACAVSLVTVETVRALPLQVPALPPGRVAVRTGAAALLVVSLFLPWQRVHGQLVSGGTDGWYLVTGAVAGSLCLLLLAAPMLPALQRYVLDAVVAVVLLVSAVGTAFRQESFVFGIGYGASVGFASAGVLLITALLPLISGHVDPGDWARARARAAPLITAVLCVIAIVLPLWFVLPRPWEFQAAPLDYDSWLTVSGLLLALCLVRLWVLRTRGAADTGGLILVPLTILTLASLELIRFRDDPVIWGAVILIGLCLLLALFGWIEQDRGLEGFRVPDEIWRVDRLPEPEG